MNFTTDPFQIPEDQQTPLVKWLLEIIRDNKQLIETQAKKIEELKIKVEVLDDELKKLKKLPPKPDIKKSTLNENPEDKKKGTDTKRPGSDKESGLAKTGYFRPPCCSVDLDHSYCVETMQKKSFFASVWNF